MTDILLAKPNLPEDFIDFSVGEPHIVRESLFNQFEDLKTNLSFLDKNKASEYPSANGYTPLVKLLEDKHNAPVIITNGAKQALAGSFYALSKKGYKNLGMRCPYWALIPPLANMLGLNHSIKYDSYLAILPNNPDGFMMDYEYANYLYSWHKELKIPFIHDAAYYTKIYADCETTKPLGDMQIYSISKMYGISGIRVGYVVCHDTSYYKLIQEYIESTTVGVSNLSQNYCFHMLTELKNNPEKEEKFISTSREKLKEAKLLFKAVNPDVLIVPENVEDIPGMFLWAKVGSKCDFARAKINPIDGKLFGKEGMTRINLGLPTELIKEAVNRLNSL